MQPGICVVLGAFTKLQKLTYCFVMSVQLTIYVEQPGSHRTDFH